MTRSITSLQPITYLESVANGSIPLTVEVITHMSKMPLKSIEIPQELQQKLLERLTSFKNSDESEGSYSLNNKKLFLLPLNQELRYRIDFINRTKYPSS